MMLSRDRRYKSVKEEQYISELREIFKIGKDVSSLMSNVSISPGTSLMEKISDGLWTAITKKKFMDGKIIAILDDTHLVGEGENKILNFVRYIKNLNDKVCIYSPDADLCVLSMQYAGDIYNIREKRFDNKEDLELYPDPEVKHIILSINKYRNAIKQEIGDYDEIRIAKDYMFISFFIGNDFIKPFYFTKSNKNGYETIVDIYKKLLPKYKNTNDKYLIKIENQIPMVNIPFLTDMLQELAKMEDRNMKQYYSIVLSKMEKHIPEVEQTFETKKSSFIHDEYYKKTNPFAEPELFKKIDYNKPHNVWKQEYYSFFFSLNPDNAVEFKNYKRLVCIKYLESLCYCLKSYLSSVPSWKWYYPFKVAPMPSDILQYMNEVPQGLNFKFELGKPYYPVEQLTLMIPPQLSNIIPKPLKLLITSPTSPLIPYYPVDFKLEKVFSEKFEYSKAILPAINDEITSPIIQETFSKFTKGEKDRNELLTTYKLYEPPNLLLKDLLLESPRLM